MNKVSLIRAVAADTEVYTVLEMFERHGARIVDFIASGESGGNPEFILVFDTKEAALALLKEHEGEYGEDDEEFLRSQIKPLFT